MSDGLILDDIRIRLGGRLIVSIQAQIEPGKVLTVMGPSGVGKSTLLSAVIGTLDPAFELSGAIRLHDRNLTNLSPDQRRVGVLFQDDLLFPHMSVGQNLGFGLRPGGSRPDRLARINAALAEVGLNDMYHRDPATLSGGQKARVSLMRMLLSEPHALLLDEAFSRLDTDRRARTRNMVFDTAKRRNLPVLMVTHDRADADAAGGRIIVLGKCDAHRDRR